MRIGLGIPNNTKVPSTVAPPTPLGWIADLLAAGGTVSPGSTGTFEVGIGFTQLSASKCKGIRALWNNPAVGTSITFNLWKITGLFTGTLVATETLPVANGYVETTAAFGSHTLTIGDDYCVSIYVPGLYNHFISSPIPLPKVYPDCQVITGYQYYWVPNSYPPFSSPGYGAFVEPMY